MDPDQVHIAFSIPDQQGFTSVAVVNKDIMKIWAKYIEKKAFYQKARCTQMSILELAGLFVLSFMKMGIQKKMFKYLPNSLRNS